MQDGDAPSRGSSGSLKPGSRARPTNRKSTKPRLSAAEEAMYAGLPEELRPIFPGGGSKFDDWEREKLEKNKLSLKKDLESANAKHDAESFRSCSVCRKFYLGFYLYLMQLFLLIFYQ